MFKQFKLVKALALAAICLGGGNQLLALASTSSGSTSSTATSSSAGAATYGTSAYYAYQSVATTPGATVTEASVMAVKVTKILGLVSAVTAEASEAMRGNKETGVAGSAGGVKVAGSSGSQHRASAWMRVSMGAIDNATSNQEWNGQSYLTMVGADYKFNNTFCAGLGLSYSRLNARTEFNNGHMRENTYGVNPYLIIVPHKNFNFEFVGGYSTSKSNDDRRWITTKESSAGTTNVDETFKSSPKRKAMFGGVFANLNNKVNKTSFNLQVGYIVMQSKVGAFNERATDAKYAGNAVNTPSNTFKAQTATGKILVSYQMTPSVAPFVTLHGQYDVKKANPVGFTAGNQAGYVVNRSAFGGGAGFSIKNEDALSGSLQFDYTKRGQLSTYVTGLRFHYGF